MNQACASAASAAEAGLRAVADRFSAAEKLVDQAVRAPEDEQGEITQALHRQWMEAAAKVASLPASTPEGLRAKASVLLAVLAVLAPATGERDLHEILAESLARDLVHIREW